MKTFIINVSTNESRRLRMLDLISKHDCLSNSSFMHDGDLGAITTETFAKYFGGELKTLNAVVSCAYKHILCYYKISEFKNDEYALILEDDIFLNSNFCSRIESITKEIKEKKLENFLISLEDSNLKYVEGSERKKGMFLYKRLKGRMAGAYIVDSKFAQNTIKEIEQNKCNLPIDWLHNYCSNKELINIYWAQPSIAIQGSLNGKMESTIDSKPVGYNKILKFNINRFYKKLLYRLR